MDTTGIQAICDTIVVVACVFGSVLVIWATVWLNKR